jgi:hypothetical protein
MAGCRPEGARLLRCVARCALTRVLCFLCPSKQKRFVTLTLADGGSPTLRYFKQPNEQRPRGFVNLADVTALIRTGERAPCHG